MHILEYIVYAFIGGVILNIMPCVLPVLTLKVFHTIESFGDVDHDPRAHGLAYGAGTVFAFSLLAAVIVGLRASGETLGWGMHFQHPPFVAALTAVIFVFGLNSLGVFEINIASSGKAGEGAVGSFLNGVFAAVMSTPCTAPFLATAAGFALAAQTSTWETFVLFATIGFGLAFPYMLISFIPAVGRMLPKPGPWMVTFKHLMGFTLLATAVWLFRALLAQLTASSAGWFLGFLLVLAIAVWAVDRFATLRHSSMRRHGVRFAVLVMVIALGARMIDFQRPPPVVIADNLAPAPILLHGAINWLDFSPARLRAEHQRKRPVFVNYTADWCAACKTNEMVFLETDTVRNALAAANIPALKADMTNENEMLETRLDELERTGIPAYAIYMPDGSVDLLPQVITATLVAERLTQAAQAFSP